MAHLRCFRDSTTWIAALAPFGGQEGAELSIGASHTVAVHLLPKLLPIVLREWPKLRIHIVGGSTAEILQALIFLDDPADSEFGLIDPAITTLRSQLTSARFATLTEKGGTDLGNLCVGS